MFIESSSSSSFIELVMTSISIGLQDDWSQIRLHASQACQSVLIVLMNNNNIIMNEEEVKDEDDRTGGSSSSSSCRSKSGNVTDATTAATTITLLRTWWWWCLVIPRLCMNRYYAAEAVQSVSQNIWRSFLLPEGLGRQLIVMHIQSSADYYCSMTASKNHMIVEAACQAITELITHIDHHVLLPLHIQSLTGCILTCLNDDDRWPVRDAACVSIGVILSRYPSQWNDPHHHHPQQVVVSSKIISSWRKQLVDSIQSVREHAAISISTALQSSDDQSVMYEAVMGFSLQYIRDFLLLKEKQKPVKNFIPLSLLNSHTSTTDSTGSTPNNIKMKSNNNIRSGWGCCVDCVDLRPAESWEICHGAIYLLRELIVYSPDIIRHEYMRYGEQDVTLYEALLMMLDDDYDVGDKGSLSVDHKYSIDQLRISIYTEVLT